MSQGKIDLNNKTFSEKWTSLLKNGQPLIFHRGQALFYEGHFPYGVYWIRKGDVKFTHRGRCSEKHDQQSCESIHHQWFGFSELASSKPHCCTCEAETECEVVFVNKNQFLSLLPSLPIK